MDSRSALYRGHLVHARTSPARHVFRYPLAMVALDLDRVVDESKRLRLFGHNRPAPVSFHDHDHLGLHGRGAAANARALARDGGVDDVAGRVVVVTNPRTFGYTFNPVSFWFLYGAMGNLSCALAEVNNTFGERHTYLLDDLVPGDGEMWESSRPKRLHVSPFFGLDQEYRFRLREPGERFTARIDVYEGGERPFWAVLEGRASALDDRGLAGYLLGYPLMPVRVFGGIHLQAARLMIKRVPFHRKPPFDPADGSRNAVDPAPSGRRGLSLTPAARRTPLTPILEAVTPRFLAGLDGGAIELTTPDGTRRLLGDPGTGTTIGVTIRSRDLWRRIGRRGTVGLGEAWTAGDWDTDDLPGVLRRLARGMARVGTSGPGHLGRRLRAMKPHLPRPGGRAEDRRDIEYHYDLGNDFYRLFLDESLAYSCGIWDEGATDLGTSQETKFRRILERLAPSAGDHLLEIGCGWGGFACFAAREYNLRVTGITLSPQQRDEARSRVDAAGLNDQVAIELIDYRDVDGSFEHIASIEMFEAIGEAQFGGFFAACDRLLAPGGRACIQTIAVPEQKYARYRRETDWIREYIFPGALIPSLGALLAAASESSRLALIETEEIGAGYGPTLAAWRESFLDNQDSVRALGFDDEFIRAWDYYLAFCEAGFREGLLLDYQVVFGRTPDQREQPARFEVGQKAPA